jgi:hypothetical protein
VGATAPPGLSILTNKDFTRGFRRNSVRVFTVFVASKILPFIRIKPTTSCCPNPRPYPRSPPVLPPQKNQERPYRPMAMTANNPAEIIKPGVLHLFIAGSSAAGIF